MEILEEAKVEPIAMVMSRRIQYNTIQYNIPLFRPSICNVHVMSKGPVRSQLWDPSCDRSPRN